jgi:hypothetical protein
MTPRVARIILIGACAALLAGLGLAAWQTRRDVAPVPTGQVRATERALADLVASWVRQGPAGLARDDGYVMTIDIGQMLVYAAEAGDRETYDALRSVCLREAIVADPAEPFTRGMVRWRFKAGVQESATGTTEALRVAEGLWRGAEAFGRAGDRELALEVCRAYARHATYDQTNGVWLIRNYCSLLDKHFADNSYLIDYDPDFLAGVAAASGDAGLRDVAARSLDLVRHGAAPCGLIYDLVEPGVGTMLPGTGAVFGPNDVVQVSNATAIAERCVRGNPALARGVLGFALGHAANLKLRYYGRTGEPASSWPPGPETYAGLVRLAAATGDRRALAVFLPVLLGHARDFAARGGAGYEPRLFEAGEMLLALHAAEGMDAGPGGRAALRAAAERNPQGGGDRSAP